MEIYMLRETETIQVLLIFLPFIYHYPKLMTLQLAITKFVLGSLMLKLVTFVRELQ